MKKRVFIAHGWDGYPEEGWFPWLKKELEAKGFEVYVPQLPETGSPRIHNWVPKLAEVVGEIDENTYFVGYSMGCQTIARYLETLPEGVKVGGAVFVAGFFKRLTGLVSLDNQDDFRNKLGSEIIIEKNMGHFSGSTGVTELPIALESLLKIA